MTVHVAPPFAPHPREPAGPGNGGARLERIRRLIDSMVDLPDVVTAGPAACALLAGELADAGISLTARHLQGARTADLVLADYPPGIGLADIRGAETMSARIDLGKTLLGQSVSARIVAWRTHGDRCFTNEERELLSAAAPRFAPLAVALVETTAGRRPNALDPETGLWPLPSFLSQADRRFDRLDIEERVGTMFAIGWVRSDGAAAAEASSAIIRASAEALRDMLRPSDLIGRVAPTRLAAWCDGVDHLVAAERGDRIVTKLDSMLAGSGRHAAMGISSRWPRSGDDPETVLTNAKAGLEQARLTAAANARPAVRIWQPEVP